MEDIEEAFIYKDIPTKNLKGNVRADGTPTTLVTFSVVNSSDRTELLKSGLVVNNKKAVIVYINRDKLVDKFFTCNNISHLTKNCK